MTQSYGQLVNTLITEQIQGDLLNEASWSQPIQIVSNRDLMVKRQTMQHYPEHKPIFLVLKNKKANLSFDWLVQWALSRCSNVRTFVMYNVRSDDFHKTKEQRTFLLLNQ